MCVPCMSYHFSLRRAAWQFRPVLTDQIEIADPATGLRVNLSSTLPTRCRGPNSRSMDLALCIIASIEPLAYPPEYTVYGDDPEGVSMNTV